jgi:hypothetical protein
MPRAYGTLFVLQEGNSAGFLHSFVSHSSGSSTQKRPHEQRGRGLMQNESDLLDTDLLPIRTTVEIHQSCVKPHQWLTPSSFALLHASVPQEFSS